MQIYPAIDIRKGKCVRLKQGDFNRETIFNDSPAEQARIWVSQGASYLHIVDLDGAKLGSSYNNGQISEIVRSVSVPIQVGGGIRTISDIEDKLNLGVDRVILGTAAVHDKPFVAQAVKLFKDRIAVGIDAVNNRVAVFAWDSISDVSSDDLCKEIINVGIKTIIYTDISKDGMMSGPNFETTKALIDLSTGYGVKIIASGGISTMADLEDMDKIGASGAIIGKALYDGAIDLNEAISQFEK